VSFKKFCGEQFSTSRQRFNPGPHYVDCVVVAAVDDPQSPLLTPTCPTGQQLDSSVRLGKRTQAYSSTVQEASYKSSDHGLKNITTIHGLSGMCQHNIVMRKIWTAVCGDSLPIVNLLLDYPDVMLRNTTKHWRTICTAFSQQSSVLYRLLSKNQRASCPLKATWITEYLRRSQELMTGNNRFITYFLPIISDTWEATPAFLMKYQLIKP